VIGWFIQEDTYYGDGLNLYEYCRNNTITYKDPTGHNICATQRDLYHKYKEEGMSPQEAYQKMRKELGLDSKSGYKDSGVGNGKDPWRSYESGRETVKIDEFFIDDWTGYPDAPKPDGPFRILEGTEYTDARNLANKTNANIHRNRPDLKGTQIHEMHPVKLGGSPTDIDNKIALSPKEHAKYTAFWNKVLREQKGKLK